MDNLKGDKNHQNNSRFNFYADTIDEAKEYIYLRAKQLLKHDFTLTSIHSYFWGVSAYFDKEGKIYQSIYILNSNRGKKIFQKNITHTILTSNESGIEEFLKNKNIDYLNISLTPFKEYEIISSFYANQKTKRSRTYLMNHIDEGFYILNKINASEFTKKAFCLHPLIQSDKNLSENYLKFKEIENHVIILLFEYRNIANQYLSNRRIYSLEEINLSPLKEVNDMLIADKIQNKKDFEIYHKSTHKRSQELSQYFNNWLNRLNVSDYFYSECFRICK